MKNPKIIITDNREEWRAKGRLSNLGKAVVMLKKRWAKRKYHAPNNRP